MKFLEYLNNLHKLVEEFLSNQWTLGSLIVVALIVLAKNYKFIYLLLRVLFNAKAVYKYFFDKSVRVKGETFLLSFNDSVTIDEQKQHKQYESLTRIKLHRNNEKSTPLKLKLQTSLVGGKVNERDSYLYMAHDVPELMVVQLSNTTFDSLDKAFNQDGMRAFIEFDAYKSMSKDYLEMYNFSSLKFQLLKTEEFQRKITLMMFLEIMEKDISKLRTNTKQKKTGKK